jgi:hypothetical protein
MNDIDPRAAIFAAIERARIAAGVTSEFIELERAVINDLLDRVRVPRGPLVPVEIERGDSAWNVPGGPLVPGVEF